MKIEEVIKNGIFLLKEVCEKPRLESEMLLSSILNVERIFLHMNANQELDEVSLEIFNRSVKKRATHYPLEYIIGKASFYSEEFFVEEGVLIPRPETEILVDLARKKIEEGNIKTVAEVGVGSGIVSIMLATMFENVQFIGSDINPKAIALAQKNAKKFGVADRIDFRESSKLDRVEEDIDLLLSNPPYIEDSYVLPENVQYEPKEALFGGRVGDEFVKSLIDLKEERNIQYFICEFGYDQKKFILDYCEKKGYKTPKFYQDLSNLDRGFSIE